MSEEEGVVQSGRLPAIKAKSPRSRASVNTESQTETVLSDEDTSSEHEPTFHSSDKRTNNLKSQIKIRTSLRTRESSNVKNERATAQESGWLTNIVKKLPDAEQQAIKTRRRSGQEYHERTSGRAEHASRQHRRFGEHQRSYHGQRACEHAVPSRVHHRRRELTG